MPDRRPAGELPPGLEAMWRALVRGYCAEPRLLPFAFGLALFAALPDALIALWIKFLADGILRGNRTLATGAALGLAASATATWFLKVVSDRAQRRFRDRVTVALEAHIAGLQASVATIEHHERPEYVDRLSMLRDQVFVLDHMYMSLFTTCGWILRLAVIVALLISIHPLLGLLIIFAAPTVITSAWRPGVERGVEERSAPAGRLARHLFTVATTAAPGKEVRVTRTGPKLAIRRLAAWERWYRPISTARWATAGWNSLAWAIFGAGWAAAVWFVIYGIHASPGQVLLILVAGSQLSAYVGAAAGEVGFLRGFWLEGSRRMAWLEDYAASLAETCDLPAPARLSDGIRFERVSFAYPGTTRRVLDDINLHLRPGSVVAIVGENGAGKSTLVKLLARLYPPDSGRILVDGSDLARIPAEEWRARIAGAFQDFFQFEFRVLHTIGLGDLPHIDDSPAVARAVDRAGADDVVGRLASGLDTQLGPTWPGGVDLSFGQWQKLALARGFMRPQPLLLVLDEPTAALDAETEHALFERYAAVRGPITILVSHRFSTVRMADTIVVLDGSRIAEIGSHEELIARGGQYAALYSIQAAAYKTGAAR